MVITSALGATTALIRYDCEISHTRTRPVRHRFRYRSPLWLVDLDAVPRLPRWLRFAGSIDPGDHWSTDATDLRSGIDEFLASHGRARAQQVLLLTGHRSFGQVFNPLSVYWCYDADGAVTSIVAEVHNTYSGRHAYLLAPDDAGRDDVEKCFYVSPFFSPVGRYRMRISAPSDRVDISIALQLETAGDAQPFVPFTATLHGTGRPVSRWGLLSRPLAQLRVVALIKWEGIRLWRKGVQVQPRTGSPDLDRQLRGNLRPAETVDRVA